ncbi:MAG: T9SS type A sorting domain-containing protein [Candidatus Marinimicrobia bacterium]|nr:T9SS type A sorting domain-containing protein [Candidatus Neomarinimicrobiota bacterium]
MIRPNQGIPIEGLDGQVDLYTDGSLASQNKAKVEMEWVVPKGLEKNVKVYAVVDPEDAVSEIHENNNIGFIPLNVRGATGIEEQDKPGLVDDYILHQNYPNPCNPNTTITYELPERHYVYLTVYDIYGRKVKTLVDQFQDKGYQSVIFDAADLASGVYLYRLKAGLYSNTKKLIVLK